MNKPKTVTVIQFAMNLGTSIIGVGILAFPRITMGYVQSGATLATFFGVLLIMLFGLILAYLGSQYPNMTLFEYSEAILGKWVSVIFELGIILYFAELAALAAREFGEVVVTSVLQRTPVEITILIMLVLATIAARNDVAVFSRILTFYMPFVYVPAIVVVVLTLRSARLTNILPLISPLYESPVMNLIFATLVVAALFQNYFVTGLLTPFMHKPKDAWKGILIGVGAAGVIYLLCILGAMSVFGTEETTNLLWPTLELAKTAALPLFLLERIDPIFLAVWVTAVFTAILASYYVTIQGLAHFLRFQNHRVLTLIIMPLIFLMAMQSRNIAQLYKTVTTVGVCGLALTLGYPLILLVVHWLKGFGTNRKKKVKTA